MCNLKCLVSTPAASRASPVLTTTVEIRKCILMSYAASFELEHHCRTIIPTIIIKRIDDGSILAAPLVKPVGRLAFDGDVLVDAGETLEVEELDDEFITNAGSCAATNNILSEIQQIPW